MRGLTKDDFTITEILPQMVKLWQKLHFTQEMDQTLHFHSPRALAVPKRMKRNRESCSNQDRYKVRSRKLHSAGKLWPEIRSLTETILYRVNEHN